MPSLHLSDMPTEEDLRAIAGNLATFNEAEVGASGRQSLTVLIKDDTGLTCGGLSGSTAWQWLYVQLLFVPEALRGRGLAGALLERAEAEARRRGCHGAWIDTFNPVALKTYCAAGYDVFGTIPEFLPGRARYFLRKTLM